MSTLPPTPRPTTPAPASARALSLVPTRPPSGAGVTSSQPRLPLEFVLENGVSAVPPLPRRLRLVSDDGFGPVTTPMSDLPPAGPWAARLGIAVAEVLSGIRPTHQLARWVSHEVYEDLRRRDRSRRVHPSAQSHSSPRTLRNAPSTLRALRLCAPADGVIEATAIVAGGRRPVALGLRLEGLDGRWLCTQIGTADGMAFGAEASSDDSSLEAPHSELSA